jgi:pyruvate kinase
MRRSTLNWGRYDEKFDFATDIHSRRDVGFGTRHIAALGSSHSKYAESQRNLLHHIALRNHDLRPLQHELAVLGLSSLGRVESHVLASIDAVLAARHSLDGTPPDVAKLGCEPCDFERGARLLELHSCDLIGANPTARTVRIMVTLPPEAETDYTLIHALLRHGMNVARINCAHDGPAVWERMIQHIRRVERAQGRACRILMDLGGPKLRTGPVEDGPAVIKLRPQRDAFGAVLHPARVWLTRAERPAVPPTEADASVPVTAEWMARLHIGDQIQFKDARGAQRQMSVVDITNEGCWAEADKAEIKKQSMMRQLSLARTFMSKRNNTLSLWESARSTSPTGRSLKVG